MSYKHSFDSTPVGDWGWSYNHYVQIQEGLIALLQQIKHWNQVAANHGAARKPYEKEDEDIERMIAWGREKLEQSGKQAIITDGISIGSLRYVKAALVLLAQRKREEIKNIVKDNWPSQVIASLEASIISLERLAERISYSPADLLQELLSNTGGSPLLHGSTAMQKQWDVFICHASEDKDEFVRPLAVSLQDRGVDVWYDEFTLRVGDSLRRSIEKGLSSSRYGIVVISPSFLGKDWPQRELDGLMALEVKGRKVILPVWHEIDVEGVRKYSPLLADRFATSSSKGIEKVVSDLLDAINTLG